MERKAIVSYPTEQGNGMLPSSGKTFRSCRPEKEGFVIGTWQ